MATIALNPDPAPTLGATVTFTVTDVPKNAHNPRVEVVAYAPDNDEAVIYEEAGSVGQATGDGTDPLGRSGFLLGGASSIWQRQGGPAHCIANLFEFRNVRGQNTQVIFASTEFDA